MQAFTSLFTRKKPLTSTIPNTARNNFAFVNPALANKNIRNKLNRYVKTYKNMNSKQMAVVQKELQNYAQKNPTKAREVIQNRFNRRSHSNLSNMSNEQIENLRNELLEPGVTLKRILNRMEKAGLAGGCFCRKTRRNRVSRRNRRKSRRCGCL
jgi:hypothetical protein